MTNYHNLYDVFDGDKKVIERAMAKEVSGFLGCKTMSVRLYAMHKTLIDGNCIKMDLRADSKV